MSITLRYPPGATRGSVAQHKWNGMTLLVLRTDKAVACPHCGRRRRRFWSHVVSFRVAYFPKEGFEILNAVAPVYPPGLFVCYSGCELLTPIFEAELAGGGA